MLDVESATIITSGKGASYPTSTISMKFYYYYQTAATHEQIPNLLVHILVINTYVKIFASYNQDSPVKYIIVH